MRIQNEQPGSTSLFAQPLGLEPIPEKPEIRDQGAEINAQPGSGNGPGSEPTPASHTPAKLPRGLLETRLESVLTALIAPTDPPSSTQRQGHLALLKRWYYRPEVRRSGEIFFPDAEGHWPARQILRGIGRIAAKSLQIAPSA
jgi:hypothetical protein